MNTKTLTLFSYTEDNIQTDIKCLINKNESFENKGKIIHVNKSNIQHTNNERRREKYNINKDRTIRLNTELNKGKKELEEIQKDLEHKKKLEMDMKRNKELENECNIDMNEQLEDMESYY